MMSRSQSLTQRPLVFRRFGGERAVGGDRADQWWAFALDEPGPLGLEQLEIHFAEGRGLMDNARARIHGDEIGRHDAPGDVFLNVTVRFLDVVPTG